MTSKRRNKERRAADTYSAELDFPAALLEFCSEEGSTNLTVSINTSRGESKMILNISRNQDRIKCFLKGALSDLVDKVENTWNCHINSVDAVSNTDAELPLTDSANVAEAETGLNLLSAIKQEMICSKPASSIQENIDSSVENNVPTLPKRRVECSQCACSFLTKKGLQRHMIRKHRCSTNETKSDSTKQLTKPSNTFTCKFCGVQFKTLKFFKLHLYKKHQQIWDESYMENGENSDLKSSAPENPETLPKEDSDTEHDGTFFCLECDLKYATRRNLVNHIKTVHKDLEEYQDLLFRTEDELFQRDQSKGDGEISLQCCYCPANRTGRWIFRHLSICHEQEEDLAVKYEAAKADYQILLKYVRNRKRKELEKQRQSSQRGDVQYKCRFCEKSFKLRTSRSNHERFRCQNNPDRGHILECYTCGFVTVNPEILMEHKLKHTSIENICQICGKGYQTRAGLVIHKRKTHKMFSKRPIILNKCEICGKEFYDRDHLNKHVAIHSDARPFQCDLCGRQYKTGPALQKHVKMIHHNNYKYHCEKCGHGVAKAKYLKTHVCGRVRRVQAQESTADAQNETSTTIGHIIIVPSTGDTGNVDNENLDSIKQEQMIYSVLSTPETNLTSGANSSQAIILSQPTYMNQVEPKLIDQGHSTVTQKSSISLTSLTGSSYVEHPSTLPNFVAISGAQILENDLAKTSSSTLGGIRPSIFIQPLQEVVQGYPPTVEVLDPVNISNVVNCNMDIPFNSTQTIVNLPILKEEEMMSVEIMHQSQEGASTLVVDNE